MKHSSHFTQYESCCKSYFSFIELPQNLGWTSLDHSCIGSISGLLTPFHLFTWFSLPQYHSILITRALYHDTYIFKSGDANHQTLLIQNSLGYIIAFYNLLVNFCKFLMLEWDCIESQISLQRKGIIFTLSVPNQENEIPFHLFRLLSSSLFLGAWKNNIKIKYKMRSH